jgi:hypothetical protein
VFLGHLKLICRRCRARRGAAVVAPALLDKSVMRLAQRPEFGLSFGRVMGCGGEVSDTGKLLGDALLHLR